MTFTTSISAQTRPMDVRAFSSAITSAGGVVPPITKGLLDGLCAIDHDRKPATPTSAYDPIVGAIVAGKLDELERLFSDGALAVVVNKYRAELEDGVAYLVFKKLHAALIAGEFDAVRDSLLPSFDAAAKTIREVLEVVDLNQSAESFMSDGTADQLAAYQRLAPAISTLNSIAAVVKHISPSSYTLPLIAAPGGVGSLAEWHIRDEALFFCTGSLEVASDVFNAFTGIDPRRSPWPRLGELKFATLSEANDRLDEWAHAARAARQAAVNRDG